MTAKVLTKAEAISNIKAVLQNAYDGVDQDVRVSLDHVKFDEAMPNFNVGCLKVKSEDNYVFINDADFILSPVEGSTTEVDFEFKAQLFDCYHRIAGGTITLFMQVYKWAEVWEPMEIQPGISIEVPVQSLVMDPDHMELLEFTAEATGSTDGWATFTGRLPFLQGKVYKAKVARVEHSRDYDFNKDACNIRSICVKMGHLDLTATEITDDMFTDVFVDDYSGSAIHPVEGLEVLTMKEALTSPVDVITQMFDPDFKKSFLIKWDSYHILVAKSYHIPRFSYFVNIYDTFEFKGESVSDEFINKFRWKVYASVTDHEDHSAEGITCRCAIGEGDQVGTHTKQESTNDEGRVKFKSDNDFFFTMLHKAKNFDMKEGAPFIYNRSRNRFMSLARNSKQKKGEKKPSIPPKCDQLYSSLEPFSNRKNEWWIYR